MGCSLEKYEHHKKRSFQTSPWKGIFIFAVALIPVVHNDERLRARGKRERVRAARERDLRRRLALLRCACRGYATVSPRVVVRFTTTREEGGEKKKSFFKKKRKKNLFARAQSAERSGGV